jgi:hypothetical protein
MPHHDVATYNSLISGTLISAHFHFGVLVHAFLDMLT